MCDERERLIGYVYGESDADDRRAIDRHLEGCDVCRSEIRGLRRTREDLLAWGVPEHGSVWTPFAPPAAPPWYRQVPAWAMAAAASVMFVAGASGGVVAHAVLSRPAPAQVAAASPRPGVLPVAVTPDQLSAAERRILGLLREELNERLTTETSALASNTAAPRNVANPGIGIEQIHGIQTAQADFLDLLTSLTNDVGRLNQANAAEFQRLERKVDSVTAVLASSSAPRGPGDR